MEIVSAVLCGPMSRQAGGGGLVRFRAYRR